ncbi:MAG TPA: hypothetical protein VM434_16990, partial [Beijerinckiaceae bacterium]|nr:hypothetical protein [Beijerinckiaceae bacterium]
MNGLRDGGRERPGLAALLSFVLLALICFGAEQPRAASGAAVSPVEDGLWETGDAPLLLGRKAAEPLAGTARGGAPKAALPPADATSLPCRDPLLAFRP